MYPILFTMPYKIHMSVLIYLTKKLFEILFIECDMEQLYYPIKFS